MKIKIKIGKLSMDAELNDTPTAKKIAKALPIKAGFNTWGDEYYFSIPVTAKLDESAKEVVELGDLGYWPPGKAFCIFFGQTPVSKLGTRTRSDAGSDLARPSGPERRGPLLRPGPSRKRSTRGRERPLAAT